MKRTSIGLLLVSILCLLIAPLSAQDEPLPFDEWEPIRPDNLDQVGLITNLGLGQGWWAYWSEDGQSVFYPTFVADYEFRLSDLDNPIAHPVNTFEFPLAIQWNEIDVSQPIAVSLDGRYAVFHPPATDDFDRQATIQVIETETQSVVAEILSDSANVMQRYSGGVFVPQFADSGVLHFLRENALFEWNPTTGEERLLIDSGNYTDIILNAQGTHALTYMIPTTISSDRIFRVYDITTAPATQLMEQIFPSLDRWDSVAISPDGTTVATGGNNGNVRLWDLSSNGLQFIDSRNPNEYSESPVIDLNYSPDGRYIGAVVQTIGSGYTRLIDAQTGEELAIIYGISGTGYTYFNSVAFHPDNETIAIGGSDGSIRFWSISNLLALEDGETDANTYERIFEGHEFIVSDLDFNTDGTDLVSASWDQTVRIWDYETGFTMWLFDPYTEPVWTATFAPSGDMIATGSEDNTMFLVNLITRRTLPLTEYISADSGRYLLDMTFNSNGSVLAGIGRNRVLNIWDVETLEYVTIDTRHTTVWHLAFSADDRFIATAGAESGVRLWGVPTSNDE